MSDFLTRQRGYHAWLAYAQGINARMGQDAQRLEAKSASPVAESHAPNRIANITTGFILAAILLTPWVL